MIIHVGLISAIDGFRQWSWKRIALPPTACVLWTAAQQHSSTRLLVPPPESAAVTVTICMSWQPPLRDLYELDDEADAQALVDSVACLFQVTRRAVRRLICLISHWRMFVTKYVLSTYCLICLIYHLKLCTLKIFKNDGLTTKLTTYDLVVETSMMVRGLLFCPLVFSIELQRPNSNLAELILQESQDHDKWYMVYGISWQDKFRIYGIWYLEMSQVGTKASQDWERFHMKFHSNLVPVPRSTAFLPNIREVEWHLEILEQYHCGSNYP